MNDRDILFLFALGFSTGTVFWSFLVYVLFGRRQ